MSSNNTNMLIIKGPPHPVAFSIYKITIGEYVYIGRTRDIYDRAKRHATDKRRMIGKIFSKAMCDMVVEHIAEAHSEEHSREVERHHIYDAGFVHGDKLLNTHHAQSKCWVVQLD